MKSKSLRTIAVAISLVTMLSFTGCGSNGKSSSSSTSTSTAKKIVNIGIMNAPSAFNPLDSSDIAQNYMTDILFRPLVMLDSNLKFQPALADSITTSDNISFTVKLNKKAKWTDGKPVTADDTLFTLGLITNPKVTSTIASKFNVLEGLDKNGKNTSGQDSFSGAKKVDDNTFVLKTKQAMDKIVFEDILCTYLKTVPQHMLKDADLSKLAQNEFFQKPTVTDGAFKFVAYNKDQNVQLEANKSYFRGTPKLSKLNFKIMQGTEITVQLQSGEIDMNEPGIGVIPVDDIDKVKKMENVNAVTKGLLPSTVQTLQINNKTITDPNVRKAISLAINRKQIVSKLLKGVGEVIGGLYTSNCKYYDKASNSATYDPAKAKELLKAAGWDSNKTIKFDVPTGNTAREQAANIIAQNLTDVGIKVEIQKYDFVTSLATAKKHDFDIYIVGFPVDPVNPDITSYIATGQTLNLSQYSNPELDTLLQTAKTTVDDSKRKEAFTQIQQIYAKDIPAPGVYGQISMGAVNKRLTYGGPKSYGMYLDLEKWDVK